MIQNLTVNINNIATERKLEIAFFSVITLASNIVLVILIWKYFPFADNDWCRHNSLTIINFVHITIDVWTLPYSLDGMIVKIQNIHGYSWILMILIVVFIYKMTITIFTTRLLHIFKFNLVMYIFWSPLTILFVVVLFQFD